MSGQRDARASPMVPRSLTLDAPKRRPDTRDRGCVGRSGTSSELAMTPASTSQPFGFDAAVDSTNTTALSMSSPVARVSCSCPTRPCRRRRRSNVFRLAVFRKGDEASDGLLPVHVGLSAVRVAHLDPDLIAMFSIRSPRCRPFEVAFLSISLFLPHHILEILGSSRITVRHKMESGKWKSRFSHTLETRPREGLSERVVVSWEVLSKGVTREVCRLWLLPSRRSHSGLNLPR